MFQTLLALTRKRECCTTCHKKLKELGFVRGYTKSTYFICNNNQCEVHQHIVHWKNGRFQGKIYAQFISKKGSIATCKDLKTKEIFTQEYLA